MKAAQRMFVGKKTAVLGVPRVLLRLKEWLRNEIRSSNA